MITRIAPLYLLMLLIASAALSQTTPAASSPVFVDGKGVLRWTESNQEVSLFGVNYTTPFAYSYRAHKRLGLSLKTAIDLDVRQFVRLGFDAYRIHVWDREVSDASGNLLQNEHLDLFDYVLARLAEHGIRIIVTPIAWWGNGWPEPDEETEGFSQNFAKRELITDQRAREAERQYLRQFVVHVNPYRKVSYAHDPSIIAVEIINEPFHPESGEATTAYINEMQGVIRAAGWGKPIFYNISENWSPTQANAVTRSNVDGISFQWYPTGLVHNRMLNGNYLFNVNSYPVPSGDVADYGKKAKMVYEFDAADIGGSFMYPAMARSFREAGMQFAAMFSYDPVQIAWSNTEYPTHFVNLLYAPSKAISLMIAAKVFRKLPRSKASGTYPENSRFDDVVLSPGEDLSEMNSDSLFLYSNSTKSRTTCADSLLHIAGCGNSSIVRYDGTGAYFLDKLEPGVWRLEVYPDVLWLRDPFEPTSMSRQVARLFWGERRIAITLPDLGENYALYSFTGGQKRSGGDAISGQAVSPGKYLVTRANTPKSILRKFLSKKEPFLEGLYLPPGSLSGIYVTNRTSRYAIDSEGVEFKFQIASDRQITGANLYIRRPGWRGFTRHTLKSLEGFDYGVRDTSNIVRPGEIEFCVAVEVGDSAFTFPDGIRNMPGKWDYSPEIFWTTKVVNRGEPLVLLDAKRDRKEFVFPHYTKEMKYAVDYGPGPNSEENSLSLNVTFANGDNRLFGFQFNASEWLKPLVGLLEGYHHLVIRARSMQDSACIIGVNLLLADGRSYGAPVEIGKSWHESSLSLSEFRPQPALLLPDSYPLFLPHLWQHMGSGRIQGSDLRMLEEIQVVVNPADTRRRGEVRESGFELVDVSLTQ